MRSRTLTHDWTLATAGKPEADPGSVEWAIYTRARLQHLLEESSSSVEHLSYAYAAMVQYQGWRCLYRQNKEPFANFEQFCLEPKPWGLGYPQEIIDEIIRERLSAKQRAEKMKGAKGQLTLDQAMKGNQNANKSFTGKNSSDIVTAVSVVKPNKRGNDPDYWTARIKRDRPDIYERMLADEFKSVRAARIAAGLIKEEKKVCIPLDIKRAARQLARSFKGRVPELIQALKDLA